jgi:hypothetical protein
MGTVKKPQGNCGFFVACFFNLYQVTSSGGGNGLSLQITQCPNIFRGQLKREMRTLEISTAKPIRF